MKNLYVPTKFKNHGLHIWCFECKKVVTGNPCKHGEQQRFQSRVYNPLTKKQDCIKSHVTRDPQEAFDAHLEYKKQLKLNNYNIPELPDKEPITQVQTVFLKEGAKKYIDYLQDIDVPSYEKKNLDKQHIGTQKHNILRFLEVVQKVEKKISNFPAALISKKHVAAFDEYVKSLNVSDSTYNAYIKSIKYFFDYLIKELKVDMDNLFAKVKLHQIHYDPEIIPVEEFEKLLSVITPENGIGTKGKKRKETVNYYRPWLKKVFIFSLLTGERLDGIVLLRWTHVEGKFLKIPNWKVNRIKKTDHYYSYTPITSDLSELLAEFEMNDKEGYIVVPEQSGRASLKSFISKAFIHFWRLTGLKRKVSFKHLRKTYLTRLTEVIGEKAMFVKHNNDKTAIKHYLNKKELLDKTQDVRLYDNLLDSHNTDT